MIADDFIVFSDLHLHNWNYGARSIQGVNSRLLYQVRVLKQIEHYARRNRIKNIYFCGDLFHGHHTLHLGPLSFAAKVFSRWKKFGFNLVLLVGNHDIADKKRSFNSLEPFKNIATIVDKKKKISDNIFALPFTSNKKELDNFLNQNFPKDSILLMHQGIMNTPINSKGFIINDEILDPMNIPSQVKWAFVGHYHSHKIINNLIIPGSPMQHTWTDSNEQRGWLHIKNDEIKHIESRAPKFIRVTKLDSSVKGNYVRMLKTNDDYKEILQEAKKIGALSTEIEFEQTKNTFVSIKDEKLNLETIIQKYGEQRQFTQEFIDIGLKIASYEFEKSNNI